jgi:hypothetical protein
VGDDIARVALTVIPVPSGGTYALFSYLARDAATARTWLQPVVSATGHTQRYLLSRLILERSDNIVINPTVYEQWSEDRREVIQKFFAMTVVENNWDFHDKYLNLFDKDVG